MTKTTTNLLGILITILAGTYFYVTYCSECGSENVEEIVPVVEKVVPKATSYPVATNATQEEEVKSNVASLN